MAVHATRVDPPGSPGECPRAGPGLDGAHGRYYGPLPVMAAQGVGPRARTPGPRSTRLCALLGALSCLLTAAIVSFGSPQGLSAGASVTADRSRIGTLQQRIAAQGSRIEQLVVRYDQAQAREAAIQGRLSTIRGRLVTDRRAGAVAGAQLRRVAVDAYVSGGSLGSAQVLLTARGPSPDVVAVYVDVAGSRLDTAITTVQVDQVRTRVAEISLAKEQANAEATLRRLTPDRLSAEAAVAADDAMLRRVTGNLHGLLAAAARRRAAAQRATEQLIAARARAEAAVTAQGPPPTPPSAPVAAPGQSGAGQQPPAQSSTAQPSPAQSAPAGGYEDPFRAVGALTSERIDQGVDYSGFGPLYAVGDGVVLTTVNGGWPGGTFISYRLTSGPAAGLVVYAAEDIDPLVQPGQSVTAGTVLGAMYEGPDGVETGWADPAAAGLTMASAAGQFSGGNTTAFGANFSQFLGALGAPGGIPQNDPPSGTLPGGWPGW